MQRLPTVKKLELLKVCFESMKVKAHDRTRRRRKRRRRRRKAYIFTQLLELIL
jgi:hypothetical protein